MQIGRTLDIDLISEPTPHPPKFMHPKCGNLCGQRGRKRFIASWGLKMSHICPCTPCPSPQGRGQRSKFVNLPTIYYQPMGKFFCRFYWLDSNLATFALPILAGRGVPAIAKSLIFFIFSWSLSMIHPIFFPFSQLLSETVTVSFTPYERGPHLPTHLLKRCLHLHLQLISGNCVHLSQFIS